MLFGGAAVAEAAEVKIICANGHISSCALYHSYFGCEKSLATDGAFRQGLP